MRVRLPRKEHIQTANYIRQVNVVNGGYTVMLAVLLSFCRSVLLCAHSI